jgi:hypothetical protein
MDVIPSRRRGILVIPVEALYQDDKDSSLRSE